MSDKLLAVPKRSDFAARWTPVGVEGEHSLIVNRNSASRGGYSARCSCGRWSTPDAMSQTDAEWLHQDHHLPFVVLQGATTATSKIHSTKEGAK